MEVPQRWLWWHGIEDRVAHFGCQRAGWLVAFQRSRKLLGGGEGRRRAFFGQSADQISRAALVDVNAVDADLAAVHASPGTP